MCGIAGYYSSSGPIGPENIAAIERVTSALAHRGPDDSGLFHDSAVVLGHRRLSILDLSADGRQPMSNENSTVRIAFNGEIYN